MTYLLLDRDREREKKLTLYHHYSLTEAFEQKQHFVEALKELQRSNYFATILLFLFLFLFIFKVRKSFKLSIQSFPRHNDYVPIMNLISTI